MRKSNAGFTLVELIVSIAASALVIGAAISFMLFGMRMDNAASETASVQSDSRIIMRVLENIAAEGEIGEIKIKGSEDESGETETSGHEWALHSSHDPEVAILSFDAESGAIRGKDDVTIIEGIKASTLSYKDNVLSCSVETESGEKYTSSVYCRVGVGKLTLTEIDEQIDSGKVEEELADEGMSPEEAAVREAFITTMFSQYGSTGIIEDETVLNGYEFATWYWAMNLRNDSEIWTATPEKVPWCAIFVSWALNKTITGLGGTVITDENGETTVLDNRTMPQNMDALVDNVMWYQFDRTPNASCAIDKENNGKFGDIDKNEDYNAKKEAYVSLGEWKYPFSNEDNGYYIPKPGDIVFFENDDTNDRADHLGVALYIEGNKLFVVEGNHDDQVGIFAYQYENEADVNGFQTYSYGGSRVIGYGVIDWDNLGKQN